MSDKISSEIVLNGLSAELLSTTGEPIGMPILKYPFFKNGDTDTKIIERRYWLYANVRNVPQLNSSLDEATASLFDFETNDVFLCEESEPTDIGCGIVEITRTFANIPRERKERMPQSITLFGIENSGDIVAEDITEKCKISYEYRESYVVKYPTEYIGKRIQIVSANARAGKIIKYSTIENESMRYAPEDIGYYYTTNTSSHFDDGLRINEIISIGIVEAMPSRNAKSTVVDGYITYKYVKLTFDAERIALPTPFGEEKGEVILTATTNPTISEYSKMVSDGTPYQCAPATISMWLGNIAEIQIPYVYAM